MAAPAPALDPIAFEDLKLAPRHARILEALLDGLSYPEIATWTGMSERSLATQLARLGKQLRRTLPADSDSYHLLAREFMSRQTARLRAAAIAAPAPSAAESELAGYTFWIPTAAERLEMCRLLRQHA